MDIWDFIAARLEEDDAAARGAGVGTRDTWRTVEWYDGQFEGGRTVSVDIHGAAGAPITSRGGLLRADGEHIARHDPARVLAEVKAKRQLLEWCAQAASSDWSAYNDGRPLPDQIQSLATNAAIDRALRAMAAPYADHPDYKPKWAMR